MSEFKQYKIWFDKGETDLHIKVCEMLESAGYRLDLNLKSHRPDRCEQVISTELTGVLTAACSTRKCGFWYDDLADYEEINIDWMRTTKPETIELNGKKWLKSDIDKAMEAAKELGQLKPVD